MCLCRRAGSGGHDYATTRVEEAGVGAFCMYCFKLKKGQWFFSICTWARGRPCQSRESEALASLTRPCLRGECSFTWVDLLPHPSSRQPENLAWEYVGKQRGKSIQNGNNPGSLRLHQTPKKYLELLSHLLVSGDEGR